MMPSHQERVKRSYHNIYIGETIDIKNFEQIVYIRITRNQIASAMSKREIEHNVFRAIRNGIFEQYRD